MIVPARQLSSTMRPKGWTLNNHGRISGIGGIVSFTLRRKYSRDCSASISISRKEYLTCRSGGPFVVLAGSILRYSIQPTS